MPPALRARRIVDALAPALAVLCIAGFDRISAARSWPIPVIGLLDEPAHLLTAWLVLNAVSRTRTRYWPWVLLGAVAIDVDHIAPYLWGGRLASGGDRPVTHSLLTVLVLLAAATVPRARVALSGLAAGVVLHFVRDVATGPGLRLWWPVRPESVLVPYWVYLLALAAIAVLTPLLHRQPAPPARVTARRPPP